jgi:hypothetical protein
MEDDAVGYTLDDAARATGLNKTTILKAIRSGKVTGVKDENGQWCIEPCELHRVYPEQKALPLEARVVDLEADRNARREQAQRLALTSSTPGVPEKPVASWRRWLRSTA